MLCQYIHIEQKRFTRRQFVPQRISFYLNQENLKQFQQAIAKKQQLLLSPTLLADFRYYILLNQYNHFSSGLTFCTYYQEQKQEIAVVQSVISLERIEQQIRRDAVTSAKRDPLDEPYWLPTIISIHYWAIAQMFAQSPLKPKNYGTWLVWVIALLIIVAIAFFSFQLLGFFHPILLLAFILVSWSFQTCGKNLLIPHLRNWILEQLVRGIFAYSSERRKIGFKLLSLI
jgi:hypothetical protein